jgi:opacity protein-like surface antigen
MKKIESALLATTLAVGLALAGSSAFAADLMAPSDPGVVVADAPAGYISVFGGYAFGNTVHSVTTGTGSSVAANYNGGYIVGGALGMNVMPSLRAELEVSYSSRGVSNHAFASGGGTGTATGSTSTLYLLGNLWYDFDTGSSITPYIGAGVGAAVLMPNITIDTGGTYKTDALALAGQLGAGVKFAVADNVSLDLGYRAKGVTNGKLDGGNGADDLTGVSYIDQSVTVGVNFSF